MSHLKHNIEEQIDLLDKIKELCDISIVVPSDSTPRIQEAHILIGHTICEGIETGLGLV